MPTDYYELLGLTRAATDDEIKKAYRALARQLHPDATGGDPEAETRFKEISVAYETLRDPERRRRYDTFGPEGEGAGAGFVGDIFEAFFGGDLFGGRGRRGGRQQARRGADAEVVVDLELADAAMGTPVTVDADLAEGCGRCGGEGCEPGPTRSQCRTCGGAGEVRRVRRSMLGDVMTAQPCGACRGSGSEILEPCTECRGAGLVLGSTAIELEIPAGIADGQRLRLQGRGHAAPGGGSPGDLYVGVRVQPHPVLERRGDDLAQELRISMTQAALGATATVESLEGPEVLEIPPGTQPGRVFKLRGRGVPSLQTGRRGDLLVEAVVEIPDRLSREEAEVLRQFAQLRGEEQDPARQDGLFSRIRSALQ